jgi:DNA-binding transcriptional ArsR family regulator
MNSFDDFEALVERLPQEEEQRRERLAKVQIINGAKLMQKHFPEPRYLWDSVLPDAGLAVMAASKAAGKTLLLLQLADAVARGREFLGLPTRLTKVLYLQLELSERRTQQRLLKMGIVANEYLHFAHRWLCGEEGLLTLADAIKEHRFGLVIVDVMQLLWPMDADTNSYQDVYSVLGPLRQLANDLGVMILLVTHRRKAETADYLDGVIGSVGITANADVVFSLIRNRGEDEAVLHIDGNDIESRKIALRFSADPLGFTLSDAQPGEIGLTAERREVLEAIRKLGGCARTHDIALSIGKKDDTTSHLLDKLADLGLLVRMGYGQWAIRNSIQSDQSIQTDPITLSRLNTLNGT